MNTNLQFIIVLIAAFLGAALNNTGEWFVSKDPDGKRNDFDVKKFLKSLVTSLYAAFGIAAAYQISQIFGVKEIIGAVMLGVAAQQANNRIKDFAER